MLHGFTFPVRRFDDELNRHSLCKTKQSAADTRLTGTDRIAGPRSAWGCLLVQESNRNFGMSLEKGEDSRHSNGKPNTVKVNETKKEIRKRRRNKWVRHLKQKIRRLEQLMVRNRTVDGAQNRSVRRQNAGCSSNNIKCLPFGS